MTVSLTRREAGGVWLELGRGRGGAGLGRGSGSTMHAGAALTALTADPDTP